MRPRALHIASAATGNRGSRFQLHYESFTQVALQFF